VKRINQLAGLLACSGALACTTLQVMRRASVGLADWLCEPISCPWLRAPAAPEPPGVFPSEQPSAFLFEEDTTTPRTVVFDLDTRVGPRTSRATLQVLDLWRDREYVTRRAVKG
jgi:hypothetical protein